MAFAALGPIASEPPGGIRVRGGHRIRVRSVALHVTALKMDEASPRHVSGWRGFPSFWSACLQCLSVAARAVVFPTAATRPLVSLLWQENRIHSCNCAVQPPGHVFSPISLNVLGLTWTSFLTPSFPNLLFPYIVDCVPTKLAVGAHIGINNFRAVSLTCSTCMRRSSMLWEEHGAGVRLFFFFFISNLMTAWPTWARRKAAFSSTARRWQQLRPQCCWDSELL